jgi:nucleotide-binding universal stress UspA family protein
MKNSDHSTGIVVGVDGSEGSRAALRWALAEARHRGVPLRVIHASGPPYIGPRGPALPMLEYLAGGIEGTAEETLSKSLRGIIDPAASGEVRVTADVVSAPAQLALVDASEGAELLVVGSRGARAHLLGIGSVTRACLHQVRSPVVVVPG